jgi:hypothetical protein
MPDSRWTTLSSSGCLLRVALLIAASKRRCNRWDS